MKNDQTDKLIMACWLERWRLEAQLEQLIIDREKSVEREHRLRNEIAALSPYSLSLKLDVTTTRITNVARALTRVTHQQERLACSTQI